MARTNRTPGAEKEEPEDDGGLGEEEKGNS